MSRPLGIVQSEQEQLYFASQLVASVANCLIDMVSCEQMIEFFDAIELAGRLDLAVDTIRHANGAK